MVINLYYIEGLSRGDTLFFSSIEEQKRFFNNKVIEIIDNSFYPPHYTNKIKLEISESFTNNTCINYLSFNYNNKEYYYFIDNITYINEYILELDITMDTIQTYLFNFKITSATVERALIERISKRGNRIVFNRNYERENFTAKEKLINKTELNDNGLYWLVIKRYTGLDGDYPFTTQTINNITISTGYLYCLIPLFNTTINAIKLNDTVATTITTDTTKINFNELYTNENIHSMYVINDAYLQTCYSDTSGIYNFNNYNGWYGYYSNVLSQGDTIINNGVLLLKIPELTISTYKRLPYTQPLTSTTPFNYKHIPFIIDDNYISVNFGEPISKATISTSLLTNDQLHFKAYYDIDTGARAYQITTINGDTQETTTLVNSCENYGLQTNAYNQYMSRNRGMATVGIANKLLNNSVQLVDSILDPKIPIAKGVTGATSNILNDITTYVNLKNTPNQEKQANNVNLDMLTNNLSINYEINYNEDVLRSVAKTIESNGYKINDKFIYSGIDLLEYYKKRTYFNYIKTSNINLDLINIINDVDTINNIKERFNNGFRYWNTSTYNIMSPYNMLEYDNIEINII